MDFWFMGRQRLTKPEAEAMLRDVLRTVGICTEDDMESCMKCLHRDETNARPDCKLDDPVDGSAACCNYDHFEPKPKSGNLSDSLLNFVGPSMSLMYGQMGLAWCSVISAWDPSIPTNRVSHCGA